MKTYKNIITLNKNDRGIWDLDTSKGCASGLKNDGRGLKTNADGAMTQNPC